MDRPCHQFFARPALSVYQHAPIGRRHQPDLLPYSFHRDTVAHDDTLRLQLTLEFEILTAHALGIERVLDHDQSSVDREGLLEEVKRPKLRRTHRGLDRAMPGDHNDLGMVFDLLDLAESVKPIHAR